MNDKKFQFMVYVYFEATCGEDKKKARQIAFAADQIPVKNIPPNVLAAARVLVRHMEKGGNQKPFKWMKVGVPR